ncbi:4'-phosphopantetheinyl transferase superfamily protein [Paraburkholderia sp. CNPSo 3157]|uniref:4'-phosphopantetheinyl transferase superfamily protein n=1 Tax=Paraburkholderia franconis TaxID=2654983 RepID=A0A7X1TJD6_9BURK|nr:4'-phosphopantetheinyl transferase superfamily protein [Paraburkholderia franconis]MPW21328.1 4'-phosphopantetheinyl transferase superfamily protein [Paraburkholderia franconis]
MQRDSVAARDASLALSDPGELVLPDNAAHIWMLNEDLVGHACSALAHTLSPDERQRARDYRKQTRRDAYIARRGMLRSLMARYLACRPESLRFGVTGFGRPVLQWPHGARLAFNVSHTGGIALFAFAWDCRVGVDVERQVDGIYVEGIGRGILSSVEEAALGAARADSASTFFRIWTRKEALLKALGTGLSGEPDAYTTEEHPSLCNGGWRASCNGNALSGWTCLDLNLGPGMQGAIAVSLENARVTFYRCASPI